MIESVQLLYLIYIVSIVIIISALLGSIDKDNNRTAWKIAIAILSLSIFLFLPFYSLFASIILVVLIILVAVLNKRKYYDEMTKTEQALSRILLILVAILVILQAIAINVTYNIYSVNRPILI